jgi:2-(1,2-epoxy-1,2-dihydrophenyl)acetyl-CoA isomerase
VPDDDVDSAAASLAQQMADGPSWALGHAKRVVYHGYENSLPAAGEYEGVVIAQSMRGHDGQEGIAAFVEKRSPDFTGE